MSQLVSLLDEADGLSDPRAGQMAPHDAQQALSGRSHLAVREQHRRVRTRSIHDRAHGLRPARPTDLTKSERQVVDFVE